MRPTGLILCQTAAAILQVGHSIQKGLAGVYIPLLTATHTQKMCRQKHPFSHAKREKAENKKLMLELDGNFLPNGIDFFCFILKKKTQQKHYRKREDFFLFSLQWTTEGRYLHLANCMDFDLKVAPGGVSTETLGDAAPPTPTSHRSQTYLAVRRGGARLQVQHVGAEIEQSGCCLFHWLQGSTNLWLSLCEGVT